MSLWPFSRAVAPVVATIEREPIVDLHARDLVVAPDHIACLLEQIREQRCLLTVHIPGNGDIFSSAIIEVVGNKGYFVLDELVSRDGNRLIGTRQRMSIRARLNHVMVRFDCEVSASGDEAGIAYYQIPFPARIEHIQKREFYRVGVPMEKHVPVQFTTEQGTLYSAELRDISLGGFGARLSLPLSELEPGNLIQRVVITLPTHARICGSGQICFSEVVQPARVSRCGVRFMHIDRTDLHALEHFIAQLDREMKRKRLA